MWTDVVKARRRHELRGLSVVDSVWISVDDSGTSGTVGGPPCRTCRNSVIYPQNSTGCPPVVHRVMHRVVHRSELASDSSGWYGFRRGSNIVGIVVPVGRRLRRRRTGPHFRVWGGVRRRNVVRDDSRAPVPSPVPGSHQPGPGVGTSYRGESTSMRDSTNRP